MVVRTDTEDEILFYLLLGVWVEILGTSSLSFGSNVVIKWFERSNTFFKSGSTFLKQASHVWKTT